MTTGPGAAGVDLPRLDRVSWLTPEELIREAFRRSRVVMMNEASSGLTRCIRTRRIGARIMPLASASGARLLAMETMGPLGGPPPATGVVEQPDMQELLEAARLQGLRVTGYDVDPMQAPLKLRTKVKTPAYTNWRDGKQAATLAELLAGLPPGDRMLVWCRNLHHARLRLMAYRPMGWRFQERAGIQPFTIDQTVTVDFGGRSRPSILRWARPALELRGGTAGFVWREGMPRLTPGFDAWLLSLDNEVVGPEKKKRANPVLARMPWRRTSNLPPPLREFGVTPPGPARPARDDARPDGAR